MITLLTGIINGVPERWIYCGFGLTVMLLLSACSPSFLAQRSPPVSSYLLEWNDAVTAPANTHDVGRPSIQLSPITAAAGFGGTQIIYIRKPFQLEHYAFHQWVEPPTRMLEPLLTRMLEESGLFSSAVGPDTAVRTDLQLDIELLYLQQVFADETSEVQLAIRVGLVNVDRTQLIAGQRFSIIEPVTEPTPYGSVQAANRATVRFLTALRAFLAQHRMESER